VDAWSTFRKVMLGIVLAVSAILLLLALVVFFSVVGRF